LCEQGETAYALAEDFWDSYPWVLRIPEYESVESLLEDVPDLIDQANELAEKLQRKK
jgi:hypothetical protein